jgi:hypothetical protein
MADEKSNAPNPRRKRPAPTIDLSATDVTNADAPRSQTADESSAAGEKTETPPPGAPPRSNRPILLAIVAGGLGGAAAVLAGLWLSGVLTPARSGDDLNARVAALETQAKAAPKADDDRAVTDLTARIGKLEQSSKAAITPQNTALSERLTSVENAMRALGVTLTALNRRVEESAAAVSATRDRADAVAKATEALQAKLDGIEQSAKATQDKVAQNAGADTAARRALAAVALRDAVAHGAPYVDELAVVKQLGADAQNVAALDPLAASGVPTEAALSRELNALLPSMIAAAGADASKAGGFLDRLQANANKLVRIHPIDEPAGDSASAVLARIEGKAAHNDFAGIGAELDKLPPKVRTLADDWRARLAARNAAIAASRKLAAGAAAALGAP